MGIGGIPLSTAIVSLVSTVALMAVLRRLIGGVDARRTLDVAVRIAIAAGLLALAALGVKELLDSTLSDSNGAQLIVIASRGSGRRGRLRRGVDGSRGSTRRPRSRLSSGVS